MPNLFTVADGDAALAGQRDAVGVARAAAVRAPLERGVFAAIHEGVAARAPRRVDARRLRSPPHAHAASRRSHL